MEKVAIVGVGLIGASFGLALRKAGFTGEILGVSSEAALEAGQRAGAISRSGTLDDAAKADLIYLSQPVERILMTLEVLGPQAKAACLITDAGSTKAAIVQTALRHVRRAEFLGGHPLAGKEQRGAEAADADLFRQRPYVLTPTQPETRATEEFRSWLAKMDTEAIEMAASEHDAVVARTSHLPQLLSTALANMLAKQSNENVLRIFGQGLIDMTRLAMSSPELWESIVATNDDEILAALDEFSGQLQEVREGVARGEFRQYFQHGNDLAAKLRKPPLTRGLVPD